MSPRPKVDRMPYNPFSDASRLKWLKALRKRLMDETVPSINAAIQLLEGRR